MITCSKIYTDIPFAHRQHKHEGHCSKIHGHNWSFKFTFAVNQLDENGFVIDFGKLKWLKEYLNDKFDHKLVLNVEDPAYGFLTAQLVNYADIVTVPNCGAEGLAQYLLETIDMMLYQLTGDRPGGRVFLLEVEVFEDSKNSAKATQDEYYNE